MSNFQSFIKRQFVIYFEHLANETIRAKERMKKSIKRTKERKKEKGKKKGGKK
jgi:hypothetical protein